MEWIALLIVEALIIGGVIYFVSRKNRNSIQKLCACDTNTCTNETEGLKQLRQKSLTMPLTEITRPSTFFDIIGQEEGIRALRVALCGANPQHVLIYGPPGIGKTCAARLVLDEAKNSQVSPFNEDSLFVEMDATCIRFDERAIADPLIGSVHDPIYQGAGALGSAGIPQPKPGAVTKAHCGVLFLDEIGELHPVQMNKLLKVLEDRCVHFESSYYSPANKNIPDYIHDIFENGAPADFRLVGATTRQPEELPMALRSRCVEIFFRRLTEKELSVIAKNAAAKMDVSMDVGTVKLCAEYARNGRDVVSIVQLAAGNAEIEGRKSIVEADIEWVASTCHMVKRPLSVIPKTPEIGRAYGLGVSVEQCFGYVMEVECQVFKKAAAIGRLDISGMIEREEIELHGRRLIRTSTVVASIQNAMLAINHCFNLNCEDYDIRFNIPGGMPVDGPSAGVTFAVALYGAITNQRLALGIALTGEITPFGELRCVGGIKEKIEAATAAGASSVVVPNGSVYCDSKIAVYPLSTLEEVISFAFNKQHQQPNLAMGNEIIAAKGSEGVNA